MTDEHEQGPKPTRRIEIPESTAQALRGRVEQSEFESIDAYAAFALELLVREIDDLQIDAHRVDSPDRDNSSAESGVEGRLESLGYL